MADFIGDAAAKILVRKKTFHYISPSEKEKDVSIQDLITPFGGSNCSNDNIWIEPISGSAIIQPLIVNRDNYMIDSSTPEEIWTSDFNRFKTSVPDGAPEETINEVKKRVFRSYPNEFQFWKNAYTDAANKSDDAVAGSEMMGQIKRGDYKEAYDGVKYGNSFEGPIFKEEKLPPMFDDKKDDEGKSPPLVTWIYQKKSHPNVEWFLAQEYGNFANEPFWIDIWKDAKAGEPSGQQGVYDKYRYTTYGKDKKLHAYFAIRIGWLDASNVLNMGSAGENLSEGKALWPVKNSSSAKVGPYDIVFPIDGTPFIYDHQGEVIDQEETDEEKKTEEQVKEDAVRDIYTYDGFVASEAPDMSWVLSDGIENFRLQFMILRGNLIINSNYTSVPWVFPMNSSSLAAESTREIYSNFVVPPGKVCIMGRGFSFRFSFNPMEFNIYKDGKNRRLTDGYHGKITYSPIMERRDYPSGSGGWVDYYQFKSGLGNIDSGISGSSNFTLMPNDNMRDPNVKERSSSMLGYSYGWDVVVDEYYGFTEASEGRHTSMMIPINGLDPRGTGAGSPKSLVNVYLRDPEANEIAEPENVIGGGNGKNYGFEEQITGGIAFKTRIPELVMNCSAPNFASENESNYTEGISERFASPVFWRWKAMHFVPNPTETEWIDLTSYVSNISYDMTSTDYLTVRQNFDLELIVPKDYNLGEFNHNIDSIKNGQLTGSGIGTGEEGTRQWILDLIYSGNIEVQVWLGWLYGVKKEPVLESSTGFGVFSDEDFEQILLGNRQGSWVRVFTGVGRAGPLKQKYDIDTITLECKDKLEILNGQIILNSPIYDGMATDDAFVHICSLLGYPESEVVVSSCSAGWNILPMAYTFSKPKLRFEQYKTVLEAAKKIAHYFMHIIMTNPDGKINLSDIYHDASEVKAGDYLGAGKPIDALSVSHPSYIFYVDGNRDEIGEGGSVPSPFQRMYENFTFDKSIEDQATQFAVISVNRLNGARIIDGTTLDVAAIEVSTSKNFVGYTKQVVIQDPAFGDLDHIKMFKDAYSSRAFIPPMSINFCTYGRPTLRPLDIIGVYHTHDLSLRDSIEKYVTSKGHTINPLYASPNYLQYRVTSVKGSIQWADAKYQFRTDVTATHI